ncbi:hypothetical protein ACFXKI_48455 [Streptomyces mirabilis]|uniref:hypothetical protein n=1 Tax=Streptomyces mirabilis TaxID=68239 RepID=UPI0036881F38
MNDDRDDIQAAPAPTYPPLPLAGEELFAEPDAQFEADFAEFFAEPLHDPASEETKAARFDAILQRGEELLLLEVKNTAPQNTEANKTNTSSASATAARPDRPQPKTVPRRTRRVTDKPPTRRPGSTPRRRKSRSRISPGRALARAGMLAGLAGICAAATMAIWSQNFASFLHLVNIPVLAVAVSHQYLNYLRTGMKNDTEREGRSKTAMRFRFYRRIHERVRGERFRRNRDRV